MIPGHPRKMKETTLVIIILAVVLIGGECLLTWIGDRLTLNDKAPFWKHFLFYLLLLLLVVAVARAAGVEQTPA